MLEEGGAISAKGVRSMDSESEDIETLDDSADLQAHLLAQRERFLAFLDRRLGSRAEAEDLLQEAFVRGLHRLEALRDEEAVVAWFYRVLRNTLVDHYRRRASTQRKLESFAKELEAQEEPAAEVRDVLCACVLELAHNLKEAYADALRQVEVEGRPLKEYAAQAGISDNHAAVRLFRARQALRKQVLRSCGMCAKHGCLDCSCAQR